MFSTEHFIWIGICAVLITALSLISIHCKFSFKTSATIMALISLASEGLKIFSHMEFTNGKNPADGMVIDPGSLPLHLCSLLIFAFFYLPFCNNQKIKSFLSALVVPISFTGGLAAILMATSGTDFGKVFAYQCFIYHAGMIWFSIYLVGTKQVDLGFRAWLRNCATLACLVIIMIWINGALQEYDTNFFYVVRPPVDNMPFLTLKYGWYTYFVHLVSVGLIGVSLVHLPFMVKNCRTKQFANR